MVLVASLVALVSSQVPRDGTIPVAAYRPAFMPLGLADARCDRVFLSDSGTRGFRPIGSRWTLKRPFLTVLRGLRRDTQLEASVEGYDDEIMGRRGLVTTYRKLPDRMIEIFVQKGRIVTTQGPNFRSEEQRDYEEYVTATFTERPLYIGPKPRTWLPLAMRGAALPSDYPGAAIPDLAREPDTWGRSMTAVGAQQYWATWYVPRPASAAFPRLLRQIERTGDWNVGSHTEGSDVRCRPKTKGSRLVWLSLSPYRVDPPDVPESVTPVTLSWTDPRR
ncbi:MAG: hypothetical protein ACO1SV_09590 [Fimbriimonas sp.]